ncbi:MAG TPA: hypothetical protein VGN00_29825 [Puia sp.]|jgi:hypothetical protein
MAFNKVIISSGHLTDKPGRPASRFPESKLGVVSGFMSRQLAAWSVGPGDLAICGGARGSDILFAELCADRGAEVWLFISLEEEDFLEQSVRVPGTDWEQRFAALRKRVGVKMVMQAQASQSGASRSAASSGAASLSPFERANTWMISMGIAQAPSPGQLYALLVWDEKPSGDGPGGTADFAEQVRKAGGQVAVINPTKL